MLLIDQIRTTVRDVDGYPKPGIVFKDITPVLAQPELVRQIIKAMVIHVGEKNGKIDAVAGIEARGFILGSILAYELGCSFIPVRKAGRLPFSTHREGYALEYGSAEIEVHTDAIKPGSRILVHDDLLATGGTACAAAKLVQRSGGMVAGFSFLIQLGFLSGAAVLEKEFNMKPHFLINY